MKTSKVVRSSDYARLGEAWAEFWRELWRAGNQTKIFIFDGQTEMSVKRIRWLLLVAATSFILSAGCATVGQRGEVEIDAETGEIMAD